MKVYKIKPDGFNEVKKKLFITVVPLLVITCAGCFVVSYLHNGHQNLNSLIITIPITIAALVIGISFAVKRQKEIFNSLEITITEIYINRIQKYSPVVSIHFEDIKQIIKDRKGNIIIKGKTFSNQLEIPAQIEKYEQLESALNQIKPITETTETPLTQRLVIPLGLLVIALMAQFYLSDNKNIVITCGSVLCIFFIFSFIHIQRDKNINNQVKKTSYLILPFVLSLIMSILSKLRNG